MDYFKYNFNEDEWNIFLIDDNDTTLEDAFNTASVHFDNKEIYFRRSEFTLKTVTHELIHVYIGYCYLHDTEELSRHDIEEIFAALFSDKGEKIIERSKDIYSKLIELRNKNDEK